MLLNTLFIGGLTDIGTKWYFWIILLAIIGFVVYSGLKKNKKEKKQRKQREKEVKKLIKKHLADQPNYQNITITYKDVIARTGKKYNNRDVFDVFLEIVNKKKGGKPILKCFEIEGFAVYTDPKDKDNVTVDWRINHEFDYQEHRILLRKKPASRLSIYLRSLFQGKNRQAFLKTKLAERKKLLTKRKTIDQQSTPNKPDETEAVFKPEVLKDEPEDE